MLNYCCKRLFFIALFSLSFPLYGMNSADEPTPSNFQEKPFFSRLSTQLTSRLSFFSTLPVQSKKDLVITGLVGIPTVAYVVWSLRQSVGERSVLVPFVGGISVATWAAWRLYPLFLKKPKSAKHAGQVKKVAKFLGYDPEFRAYKPGDTNVFLGGDRLRDCNPQGATVIITGHGLGDRDIAPYIGQSCRAIRFGANFRDAGSVPSLKTRFTGFGQEPDASALLYQLIKCQRLGVKKVIDFGHSR